MSEVQHVSREEWVARTEYARRLARFKAHLARARKAVAAEPKLTPDQLAELAAIFDQAARDQSAAS